MWLMVRSETLAPLPTIASAWAAVELITGRGSPATPCTRTLAWLFDSPVPPTS